MLALETAETSPTRATKLESIGSRSTAFQIDAFMFYLTSYRLAAHRRMP